MSPTLHWLMVGNWRFSKVSSTRDAVTEFFFVLPSLGRRGDRNATNAISHDSPVVVLVCNRRSLPSFYRTALAVVVVVVAVVVVVVVGRFPSSVGEF